MIIYNSGFLMLDFDPSTDILSVSFPPVNDIHISEISKTFSVITEHVRNYDARRLLFDARKTQVDVNEQVIAPVIAEFVRGLASTRIQKIARVESPSFFRESIVTKLFSNNGQSIQFQSFSEIALAIEWLKK